MLVLAARNAGIGYAFASVMLKAGSGYMVASVRLVLVM